MKFSLVKEQIRFFEVNKFVEFEEMLSGDEQKKLLYEAHEVLKKRLKCSDKGLSQLPANTVYFAGRDLWRECDFIKKNICNRSVTSLIAELTLEAPLRLAFDQFIPGKYRMSSPHTLQELSCFSGVVCGLLICIAGVDEEPSPSEEPAAPSLFSKHAGNVTFLNPELPIDFTQIPDARCQYLLVAFCGLRSQYVYNDKDIHTHSLKKAGYCFGDKLTDDDNPIVLWK